MPRGELKRGLSGFNFDGLEHDPSEGTDPSKVFPGHSNDVEVAAVRNTEDSMPLTKAEVCKIIDAREARANDRGSRFQNNSFHQATIYYGVVSKKASTRMKVSLLMMSFGIVILQCLVAAGLAFGAVETVCTRHDDCPGGMWCPKEGFCDDCEEEDAAVCAGYLKSGGRLLQEEDGDENPSMCDACTNPRGEFVDEEQAVQDRVSGMRFFDWTALLLASIVISFGVFAEVHDTILCEFAVSSARKSNELPGWHYGVVFLNLLRLFGFLPYILHAVVQLILYHGTSALAICLNSVAILFLVEIDNLAFTFGLHELMRAEVKRFGSILVTNEDSRIIDFIKLLCMLSIPIIIVAGVLMFKEFEEDAVFVTVVPFAAVVAVCSVWRARGEEKKALAIAFGLGRVLCGLLIFMAVSGIFMLNQGGDD